VSPGSRPFSRRPASDPTAETGALYALSVNSRAEVDAMVARALAAGGAAATEPQNHGRMYGPSFYDIDGHHWEVFWMDPSAIPG
jgi:predicted lactoylglutathione lyase